jgi:hypothetical protein
MSKMLMLSRFGRKLLRYEWRGHLQALHLEDVKVSTAVSVGQHIKQAHHGIWVMMMDHHKVQTP